MSFNFFVESANGGGSALQIVTETNVTSASPTFTTTSVSVPSYKGGGSAPQGVASFDDRIFDAADRTVNGVNHLVAAHQVASGHRNSQPVARWYDINTAATMSLIQNGNAPPGVSGAATFMPSVDINTAGSIGMTFGESARNEFWSMYVTERIASDATGTMEAAVRVANGVSSSPDSRVGDYSGTTVDPSDGLTFWSANEYQGNDFWDTHVASFKSSMGMTAQKLTSPTLPCGGSTVTQTPRFSQSVASGPSALAGDSVLSGAPVRTASQEQSGTGLPISISHVVNALFAELASTDGLDLGT